MVDGALFNAFRIELLSRSPVYSVSATLVDHNDAPQNHVLTAFSAAGEVLDDAAFANYLLSTVQPYPDEFTLTVAACEPIAFILLTRDPPGAKRLERITFSTERPTTFRR